MEDDEAKKEEVVPPDEQAYKTESVADQFTQDAVDFKSVKPVPAVGVVIAKKTVVKSFFSGFANAANSAHDVNKKKEGIKKKPKPFNIET